MAGRVLLVFALCLLCCAAGGVGAWGGGYCTESDWRDLRTVARDMTEAEIEGKYCSRKPEFVTQMRASVQAEVGSSTTPLMSSGGAGGGASGSSQHSGASSGAGPQRSAEGLGTSSSLVSQSSSVQQNLGSAGDTT
ncbi:hypothetical protein TraAM80_08784, partial [Trypanosoma rangeli]